MDADEKAALDRAQALLIELLAVPQPQRAAVVHERLKSEPGGLGVTFMSLVVGGIAVGGGLMQENPFPPWTRIAGFCSALGTLLYLMVIAAVLLMRENTHIPPGFGFFSVSIVALGVAMSFSFLTGHAAAHGKLPLPFAKDEPIAFSVVGGVAVFVVTFVLALTAWRALS